MVRAAQPVIASGGRSPRLQLLARSGVTLLGRIVSVDRATVVSDDSVNANIAFGDQFAGRARGMADAYIGRTAPGATVAEIDDAGEPVDVDAGAALDLDAADVASIIWCTGFTGDFSWVRLPLLDEAGQPVHDGGATAEPGVWFVELPWLTHRASGVSLGLPSGAERTAAAITAHLARH